MACIIVGSTSLEFLSEGHDGINDFSEDDDDTVVRWRWLGRVNMHSGLLSEVK